MIPSGLLEGTSDAQTRKMSSKTLNWLHGRYLEIGRSETQAGHSPQPLALDESYIFLRVPGSLSLKCESIYTEGGFLVGLLST